MPAPLVQHPDYVLALMEYQDGLLSWPPCLSCCAPIPDAPFTGAEVCDECLDA